MNFAKIANTTVPIVFVLGAVWYLFFIFYPEFWVPADFDPEDAALPFIAVPYTLALLGLGLLPVFIWAVFCANTSKLLTPKR